MKKSISNNKYYLLGVIFILVIWSLLSIGFDSNNLIFPNIFLVLKETIKILKSSYTYKCLAYTLARMFFGFVVAFMFALIFGTLAGLNKRFKYFITPMITVFKTIPTASLVFLFLVLSGAKYAPIYIVVLVCFPIIYESLVFGYENIDSNINDTLSLEKGSSIEKIIKVRFPMVIPYLISGIASSLGLSFKIEVMAEILTGSSTNGLGSAISYIQKSDPTNMTGIFAYSLVAIALSLIISFICEKISKNN